MTSQGADRLKAELEASAHLSEREKMVRGQLHWQCAPFDAADDREADASLP